ncbi:MAG: glutamate synthase [Betaproteobacteria bacterium RIFCSPLOWO2_02_FULL_65_24]|nr:MAG: glutamate synthase [Betaproteobacteria bacterium RIFCSPLOWO2_02_FULL_65_24]
MQAVPPCQGSCPSGEDIRGWLNIVRGIEKPPAGIPWQEYAFRRLTEANPFPAVMGRVCPAPCESGCNRNQVEDFVGINSVEHFIGEWALAHGLGFPRPEHETGKKVAIIGGGPAGLACAYQLRRKGHGCTIFDSNAQLGGMMRYGIPGYRTPRDVLDGEIQRILDLGVEVRLNTQVGKDVSLADLRRDFDAVFVGLGAQSGSPLPIPGAEAPNVIDGINFLRAFNDGRLDKVGKRVVVVGGGDTAMDVAAVARRLGHITRDPVSPASDHAVLGQLEHDVATVAREEGANVIVAYRRTVEEMPAAKHEVEAVTREGVRIMACVAPVAAVLGPDGRAVALRVIKVDWVNKKMVPQQGSEFDIPCDLLVSAVGQTVDWTGLEEFKNARGLVSADKNYQVAGKPGVFTGGDIVRPHLLTTAIGHAWIAAEGIDRHLNGEQLEKRPKIDVHYFDLERKMIEKGLKIEETHEPLRGTDSSNVAVHNYDNRSDRYVVTHEELFLGHFLHTPRNLRRIVQLDEQSAVGNFEERIVALTETQAQAEAKRCMSCGQCFECDNCIVYCPQVAVKKVPKAQATMGRYVYTDYGRCIGCHICMDVCPSGYIKMGLEV